MADDIHRASFQQMKEQFALYARHLRLETNIGVINQFHTLLEPIFKIRNALEAIHNQCSPPFPGLEAPIRVPIGSLDAEFEVLQNQPGVYQNRLEQYRQNFLNAYIVNEVHPQICQVCFNLITDMTSNMQNKSISSLHQNLPRAIDSGDSAVINQFGLEAGTVHKEFVDLCTKVWNEMYEVISHLHKQEDANVAEPTIDNNQNI